MWQFFSRMRLKWYYFLKISFHPIFEVSRLKIRKKLQLEKLEKNDEETEYFEKKRFHTSKRHLLTKLQDAKYLGVLCSIISK